MERPRLRVPSSPLFPETDRRKVILDDERSAGDRSLRSRGPGPVQPREFLLWPITRTEALALLFLTALAAVWSAVSSPGAGSSHSSGDVSIVKIEL